jgi:hypothetical protein
MSRIDRHLTPGKDIAPLTVADFDVAHDYLRAQVAVHLPTVEAKAVHVRDDLIKEAILNESSCPESIKTLALDRPTVFDILCSHNRYKPDMIAILRNNLKQVAAGTLSDSRGYYEVFRQLHPDSAQIIKGLQQQARNAQGPANIQ